MPTGWTSGKLLRVAFAFIEACGRIFNFQGIWAGAALVVSSNSVEPGPRMTCNGESPQQSTLSFVPVLKAGRFPASSALLEAAKEPVAV